MVNMKRQVFAGVMGSGPWGEPLQATYRFSSDPKFQVIGAPYPLVFGCQQRSAMGKFDSPAKVQNMNGSFCIFHISIHILILHQGKWYSTVSQQYKRPLSSTATDQDIVTSGMMRIIHSPP